MSVDMTTQSGAPLILFAKAPVSGNVKTRLSPPLTLDEASEVATTLLQESLKLVDECWAGPIFLAVEPDAGHPVFQELQKRYSFKFLVQRGSHLGERMLNAIKEVGYPCAVMGCDIPHCPPNILKQAHSVLLGLGNCIGPTADGGYYLLGLNESSDYLLGELDWGTSSVFAETSKLAKKYGQTLKLLPTLRDIDEIDDLYAAAKSFPPLLKWAVQ